MSDVDLLTVHSTQTNQYIYSHDQFKSGSNLEQLKPKTKKQSKRSNEELENRVQKVEDENKKLKSDVSVLKAENKEMKAKNKEMKSMLQKLMACQNPPVA